jgi:hypothetical protein
MKHFTPAEAVALSAKMDAVHSGKKKQEPAPADESFQDKLVRQMKEKGISPAMARTINVRTQEELDAAMVVIENDWQALTLELKALGLDKPTEDKNTGFGISKADIEAWAKRS